MNFQIQNAHSDTKENKDIIRDTIRKMVTLIKLKQTKNIL